MLCDTCCVICRTSCNTPYPVTYSISVYINVHICGQCGHASTYMYICLTLSGVLSAIYDKAAAAFSLLAYHCKIAHDRFGYNFYRHIIMYITQSHAGYINYSIYTYIRVSLHDHILACYRPNFWLPLNISRPG